jgi:hypothetical protein
MLTSPNRSGGSGPPEGQIYGRSFLAMAIPDVTLNAQ